MSRLLVFVLSAFIAMPFTGHSEGPSGLPRSIPGHPGGAERNPPGSYIKTEDGVIVYPNEDFSANTRALKIQVVSDNIIRVLACPRKEIGKVNSLVEVYNTGTIPKWDLQ